MRRTFIEALWSAGTVTILLLTLVAFDKRVREQLWPHFAAGPAVELAGAGSSVSHVTTVIAEAVRSQSLSHAPLLIFSLAATVLVLLMLRT